MVVSKDELLDQEEQKVTEDKIPPAIVSKSEDLPTGTAGQQIIATPYDASSIKALKGLEAVRKRPGMYIGSTDIKGLHHLVYEVVDNSVDEAMAGICNRIEIILHEDNSVSVEDNGRGIPVGPHPTEHKDTLEVVMTMLHAGGKFENGGYAFSSGLHGVGVSVVNALSEWCRVEVKRNGKIYRQEYRLGEPVTDVTVVGEATSTGTKTTFMADSAIMETLDYNFDVLSQRLREMAYLNSGLIIKISEEKTGRELTFYFEGGIQSFVRHLNRSKRTLQPKPIYVGKKLSTGSRISSNGQQTEIITTVEVALQYTDDYHETLFAFANGVNTIDGGTHVTGFRTALTRALNDYGTKSKLLKDNDGKITGDDAREGLTCVISVKLPDAQYGGQTKSKLNNAEISSQVYMVVNEALSKYLEENPNEARKIIEKCLTSARARKAAMDARNLVLRKSGLEGLTLPGKLADCSDRNRERTELYLVEGDSAGGCFSGDTLIALADGRALSFKGLLEEQRAGKEHFCYTIRQDGKIGLERIVNARMTRANAEVIQITLDNGEQIVCTPDHRFMLRDGTYKPASDLTPDDSLMPLYRKMSDNKEPGITINGYEMVWDPSSDRWLFTHMLADWYNRWQHLYAQADGDHCHHMDFNKLNNNPTNIQRIPAKEHLALHRKHIIRTLHRPDTISKCREIRLSKKFRSMMSERMRQEETRQILSRQAKAQWANEAYKGYMLAKWQEFYLSNEAYRRENIEQLNRIQREYWSDEGHRRLQAERVRRYFANNPDAHTILSNQANKQWQDEELLLWRREKTREQWTPEFRVKRRAALDQTYYRKTIAALKHFQTEQGKLDLDGYSAYRPTIHDNSLLRFDKFCQRYFDGNKALAEEAVANYNHRILAIKRIEELVDVYDIEVPHTHNFALANGIFVHNSAKQGRDRTFQAILPLRGKILNVERAREDRILASEEIKNLITALGTGFGERYQPERLRYGRVILMTDADVDGAHIRTLLLTFLFRHMASLIVDGRIFIAQPPLYQIKSGKQSYYAYSDQERDGRLATLDGKKVAIQRYKGLGEMNPEQLWDTTMNPATRTILQVSIEDAAEADNVFSMLMGDEVLPRRRFIEAQAKNVKNLDI